MAENALSESARSAAAAAFGFRPLLDDLSFPSIAGKLPGNSKD